MLPRLIQSGIGDFIVGVNALTYNLWRKWILVYVILGGAVVLFGHPSYAFDYYNLSQPDSTPATIEITSFPSGASVYLNLPDNYKGITPMELSIESPGYRESIILKKSGYKDSFTYFVTKAGQKVLLNIILVPAEYGDLYIKSETGDVYLDGHYKGKTPLTVYDLQEGIYNLRVRRQGYNDYSTHVQIIGKHTTKVYPIFSEPNSNLYPSPVTTLYKNVNSTSTINMNLVPLLSLSSSPPGSDVYVDGSYRGITPINITDIKWGNHTVRLVKSGYNSYSTTAIISSGQTTYVTANLSLITNVTKNPTTTTTTINPPDTLTLTPTPSSNENTNIPKSTTKTPLFVPSVIAGIVIAGMLLISRIK
jgi:hypothetical protein